LFEDFGAIKVPGKCSLFSISLLSPFGGVWRKWGSDSWSVSAEMHLETRTKECHPVTCNRLESMFLPTDCSIAHFIWV